MGNTVPVRRDNVTVTSESGLSAHHVVAIPSEHGFAGHGKICCIEQEEALAKKDKLQNVGVEIATYVCLRLNLELLSP